uniref:MYB-CC type transcription factor LHEQLE-containing domain-containing protein n=1 Tax=Aegilops tauschii TaxID=37682 RepID=M8BP62_AEGTA
MARGESCNNHPLIVTAPAFSLRILLSARRASLFVEIQRRLQVRIEEQGKRVQKMFEDQLKASRNGAPAADPNVVLLPMAVPAEQYGEEEDAVFVDVIHDDDGGEVQISSVASGSYAYDDELAL